MQGMAVTDAAASMRDLPRNPKMLINELYQRNVGSPTFTNEQDSILPGSTFTGTVELPGITGCFERVKFSGKGRSKKLAEQTAAEVAVAWIYKKAPGLLPRQAGLGTSSSSTEKLQATLGELSLATKELHNRQESPPQYAPQSSPAADLKAELEALERHHMEKPELIRLISQLEAENRALRLALAKEREVRKCAAALLAGPSTGCPADPKLA